MATTRANAPSISDETVQDRTGRSWSEWFALLDAAGAMTMPHREIVGVLKSYTELNGWWQQMVAVSYEQARGLRQKHEKPDGFQVSASRTIAVPITTLYRWWIEPRLRSSWLPEAIRVTRKTENASIRARWTDGASRLDIMFTEKHEDRSMVTVNHGKLRDAAAAGEAKRFWRTHLDALKRRLENTP